MTSDPDRPPGSEVAAADPASCRDEMVATLAGEIARYHIEKFGASATQPTYRLAMEIAETVLQAADVVPRSVAEELAEALRKNGTRCRRTYGGLLRDLPERPTCFDMQAHAADPANRYVESFRQKVLSGDYLCEGCRAAKALERYQQTLVKAHAILTAVSFSSNSMDYIKACGEALAALNPTEERCPGCGAEPGDEHDQDAHLEAEWRMETGSRDPQGPPIGWRPKRRVRDS